MAVVIMKLTDHYEENWHKCFLMEKVLCYPYHYISQAIGCAIPQHDKEVHELIYH